MFLLSGIVYVQGEKLLKIIEFTTTISGMQQLLVGRLNLVLWIIDYLADENVDVPALSVVFHSTKKYIDSKIWLY